eukprot:1129122-Pyramimonas_sp.AAC.1
MEPRVVIAHLTCVVPLHVQADRSDRRSAESDAKGKNAPSSDARFHQGIMSGHGELLDLTVGLVAGTTRRCHHSTTHPL